MSDFNAVLELIGEEMTVKLVEAYGGTRCGVPKALPEKHELRDLLGDVAFEKLHRFFGGYELKLPLAKRWRLDVYKKKGLRTKEIARKTGYTERAVSRIINNEAQASRQFKLEL